MLRTSSYTIYVDLPGIPDEMVLVQPYTGAFDKVSRRVATYVRSLEAGRLPKPLYGDWTPEPAPEGDPPQPSTATLDALVRRGYLTSMTREQEEEFFRGYADRLHGLHRRKRPSYLFMPTYDCNLRCSYCFQDHMRTDGNFRHLLRRMDPSMVDRIFLAMPKIEALHGVPPAEEVDLEVGLFGGEPLLADNLPIVTYILEKARARGSARLWAVSNATELDAYERLLAPDALCRIQVTLDGPPAEHDRRRVYADGSGSWARIARNVKLALDRGVLIAIRTNVDRNNVDALVDLADEFVRQGWDRYPNFSSQVATIRASNDKTDAKATFNTWQLHKRLAEMRAEHPSLEIIGEVDDAIKNQARRVFTQRGLPAFKSSFCAAHTGMYIFDAFGDIYACWEKTGDARIRIGSVDEQGEPHLQAEMIAQWRSRHVASNPVCLKCRYNLFCGGGCAVLAQDHGGDFYRNFCDGFAHRFREAVADTYLEVSQGKQVAARPDAFCDL